MLGQPCEVVGCIRTSKGGRLCAMHTERLRRFGEVGPPGPLKAAVGYEKKAICKQCRQEVLVLDMPRTSAGNRSVFCSACVAVRGRKSRELGTLQRLDKDRRANLRKFKMTLPEFEDLLLFQGQRCAICFSPDPGGHGNFHVDHCHATGRNRALLCTRCNTGLGYFRDDPGLIRRAASYVEQFAAVSPMP